MQANSNSAAHGASHAQHDTGLLRDELRQDVHTNAGTNNSALAGNPAPGEDAAGKGRSHATGKSIVPEKLQQKLPEKVERAVPDALHDTSDLPPRQK